MQLVEVLLNLSWLAICIALIVVCIRAERRGTLRLPLRLALAGSIVIALLLFPAISMSDDLQMTSFDVEHSRRTVESGTVSDITHLPVIALLLLWTGMALLLQALRRRCDAVERRRRDVLAPASRPDAVRPPPFAVSAFCA